MLRAFPSWHAYSNIGPSLLVIGNDALHDRVQTVGSSTVNRYSIVSAATRVKRATRWK